MAPSGSPAACNTSHPPATRRISPRRFAIDTTADDRPLFVYGTLRRGRANERHLPPHRFLGSAITAEPRPLYVAHDRFVPVLVDDPGVGHPVEGDLIEVAGPGLAFLDAFEGVGHPEGYRRTVIGVIHEGSEREAWAYVKEPGAIDVAHAGPLRSYPADDRYRPPADR
ncbi:MAG: gamma-glutamylcyclotransferase family protein [Acidimicrobiia bacterium]|nr:gamma-glutamylcyclotransferase family protein [Acidimicrobiia bacterium]